MTRIKLAFLAVVFWCAGIAPLRADVIYNNGMVNNLSTPLGDNAVVENSAPPTSSPTTLNVLTGGSANAVSVYNSSVLNMFHDNSPLVFAVRSVDAYNNSSVNVVYPFPPASLIGITPFGTLRAHDSSTVVTNGGTLGDVHALDSSVVVLNYGDAGAVSASGSSHVTVNTEVIHNGLTTRDYSIVDLNVLAAGFGYLAQISTNGHSTVNFRQSSFSAIFLNTNDSSTFNIFGSNLNYGNGPIQDTSGIITYGGTGAGFQQRIIFTRSGNSQIVINPGLTPVPEPASVTLFAIGAAGLLGYAWRWAQISRRQSTPCDAPGELGRLAGP